jgi:hypothetical protein
MNGVNGSCFEARSPSVCEICGLLVGAMLLAAPAFADEDHSVFGDNNNRSDPAAAVYPDEQGVNHLYVYTSSDVGDNTNSSLFPMTTTYVQVLGPGADPAQPANWTSTVAFEESWLSSWWPGQSPPRHLWAPESFHFSSNNSNHLYPVGYWLFVPDIENPSDQKSPSWIAAAWSETPQGPFQYYGWVYKNGDPNQNISQYASDPGPAQDPDGNPYMVFANGDGSNCGGLSLAKLRADGWGSPLDTDWTVPIYIKGLPSGSKEDDPDRCTTGKSDQDKIDHPNPTSQYLEGASLYYLDAAQIGSGAKTAGPWYLVFPRKPKSTNQVLSYATAPRLYVEHSGMVEFQYRGDLIGPSDQSWTDQGSIVKWNNQWLLFYHYGISKAAHNRKTHFECLWFNNDGTINKVARTTSGVPTCAKPPLTKVTVNLGPYTPTGAYAEFSYDHGKARATCKGSAGTTCTQYYARQSYPGGYALAMNGYCPDGKTATFSPKGVSGCDYTIAPGVACGMSLGSTDKVVTMSCK